MVSSIIIQTNVVALSEPDYKFYSAKYKQQENRNKSHHGWNERINSS